MYSAQDLPRGRGFPIRISADQRSLASPRGFSQRATSFIASWRQGIHRTPFSCSTSSTARAQDQTAQSLARLGLRRRHRHHYTCLLSQLHTHFRTNHPSPSHPLPGGHQGGQSIRQIRFTSQRTRPTAASATAGISKEGSQEPSPARNTRAWRLADSNRRPPACKAGALPAELSPRINQAKATDRKNNAPPRARRAARQCRAGRSDKYAGLRPAPADLVSAAGRNQMGQGGLEPPTPRLSSVCSNQLSYWPQPLSRRREGQPDGSLVGVGPTHPGRTRSSAALSLVQASSQPRHPKAPHPSQKSLKGGDPAAGSPTATLLRLHPSR